MKRSPLVRWSGCVLSPRTRPLCEHARLVVVASFRHASSAAAAAVAAAPDPQDQVSSDRQPIDREAYKHLPSPPHETARSSTRLNALHARLRLSSAFPIETLARCLVDPTADPHPSFNNLSLSLLGNDILGYHAGEMILCRYPRLPAAVIFAAMNAYVGRVSLASVAREWGVEVAAAPGGEVDPGLLQYLHVLPGRADVKGTGELEMHKEKAPITVSVSSSTPTPTTTTQGSNTAEESESNSNSEGDSEDINENKKKTTTWDRGVSSLMHSDNYFGEQSAATKSAIEAEFRQRLENGITLETASMGFVRAVFGATYLCDGRAAARRFFDDHVASRSLDFGRLFSFRQPTRDLSRLCAREGFEPPIARLLGETGRNTRTPVFVVGVFSGDQKLGEGSGASLTEARSRSAISALKGWYLYSPPNPMFPSDVEGPDGEAGGKAKKWKAGIIDGGEIIV